MQKLKARMREVNRVLGSPGILGRMLGANNNSPQPNPQQIPITPVETSPEFPTNQQQEGLKLQEQLQHHQQQKKEHEQQLTQMGEELAAQKSKAETLRSRIVALEADNAALRLKLETKQRLQTDFESQLHNLSTMLDGVTASMTKKKKELTKLIGALASSWNCLESEIKSRSNYSLFGTSPVITQSQNNIESIMSKIQSEIVGFGMG
eukprot:gnl/Chilomastix_caulleri/1994.p1 GENE.gnl/Chilomastix_caulleri/1994~~gnl/Chilomastix_caulleri/1994.p1  ORF type:complete len:207 (+),score=50.08 gnl/Chilomastix_caulleri/1994:320-940(+)